PRALGEIGRTMASKGRFALRPCHPSFGRVLPARRPSARDAAHDRQAGCPVGSLPAPELRRGMTTLPTGDVILELLDLELLFGDDGLNDIPDRNHTDEFLVVQHGQVSDALVGHQRHALFDRLLWTDVEDVRAHDLPDRSLLGGFSLEDHLPGIIPFREDAYQSSPFHDEQSTDILVGHHLEGLPLGHSQRLHATQPKTVWQVSVISRSPVRLRRVALSEVPVLATESSNASLRTGSARSEGLTFSLTFRRQPPPQSDRRRRPVAYTSHGVSRALAVVGG